MDYTTVPSENASIRNEENPEMVFSLYEALQELPDARRAQGKRSSLALMLCLLLFLLASVSRRIPVITYHARPSTTKMRLMRPTNDGECAPEEAKTMTKSAGMTVIQHVMSEYQL